MLNKPEGEGISKNIRVGQSECVELTDGNV